MGLSRLENFIKSVRGTIIYVDPNSLDSTDSIENQGNSLTRPFKTIQRALIEASRFSYQSGLNNDKFARTTILLYPGDHIVDNRPGLIPGVSSISEFTLESNFDLNDPLNELYKFNSVYGGAIVPRGTSIVGLDLRKTKVRPKYVPNPLNDNVDRSCIFRVTGGCYFWQFSIFDADQNDFCYIDYSSTTSTPNFSHHKLSVFEYADGVNDVSSYGRTDLEIYYEKIGLGYGPSSGREILNDYPSGALDIEPKIDEYRIVGSTGESSVISTISASGSTITVTLSSEIIGLEVDTPIRVSGVSPDICNGNYVVFEKISNTQFKYKTSSAPLTSPSVTGSSIVTLVSDTVNSASPYIFNCSLRSVYGMCGLLADGSKSLGFKSMVVAQFTGIGLQKDDNAFVVYSEDSGTYVGNETAGNENISTNSRAIFKPTYRNFHIKCINDAFIQNVSIFAIGYAEQFVAESGGDQSITNSNSNFGAKALIASGFRTNAFSQDDCGYITHIIPPKEITTKENTVEFYAIDITKTKSVANNSRLYLYNLTNKDVLPDNILQGYRIGAKPVDTLNVVISGVEKSATIIIPGTTDSYEKVSYVSRSSGTNVISNNTLTLTANHSFSTGETIRVLSNTGQLPDGIISNTVYYAINVSSNTIKLAKTQSDATVGNAITINSRGGELTIVSRVSDKNSNDIGHPIQWDDTNKQWYINVLSSNDIYTTISSLTIPSTSRTYIKRKGDDRSSIDTIYRMRYVIPKDLGGSYARPPVDGFIIQESNTSIGKDSTEISKYFDHTGSTSISNSSELRNYRFISSANWQSNISNISTELPHNLRIGDSVEILNITSTNNVSGTKNLGYNGTFDVVGISSSKHFSVSLSSNPGTFTNNVQNRTTSLPYFKRKKYGGVYYVYRVEEYQKYIENKQDGIYYLTVLNSSNNPVDNPFTAEKFSQPVKELYPQTNRDYPISDPNETKCFALSSPIGQVIVDDVRSSITKETVTKLLLDNGAGIGITNVVSTNATTHEIYTSVDHRLGRITKLEYLDSSQKGLNYVEGTFYNARLVGVAGSTTGSGATLKVVTNASGNVTQFKIMDGGSAYGIGNTFSVVGISTTTGHVPVVLRVSAISNNVGDVVRISGITSESTKNYNTLYRISNVSVGNRNRFTAVSVDSVANYSTTGIGSIVTKNSFVYNCGKSSSVSSISYNNVTGLATVTTSSNHGFYANNKVKIVGASTSFYNGDFVVKEKIGSTSFTINIGVSTNVPAVSGTIYAYPQGVTSNDGEITANYENLSGRMIPVSLGIGATLSSQLLSSTTTNFSSITNIGNLDINVGDYFQVDDEIIKVKKITFTGTPPYLSSIDLQRGALGTKASTHSSGSILRQILVKPIELRRHSILRASGHTFEYVGFGPGNYSTAFPDKQNRQISGNEELLSQSTRREGGATFYTGMNDKGTSYNGNNKTSTLSGVEEIFDTPVPTVTGEDIGNMSQINLVNSVEGSFARSIKVDGGPDGNVISEFKGPVVFSEKVTSVSTKGLEVSSLFIQGENNVSRKYTSGETQPIVAGNPGDVQYNSNPSSTDYFGWVYTKNNEWQIFGKIGSIEDLIGVGVQTAGVNVGFSTAINFTGTNITVIPQYNSSTKVSTLNFVGLTTAQILSNYTLTGSSGNRWTVVPTVSATGIVELGKTIDFHNTSSNATDYTFRFENGTAGILTAYGDFRILEDPLRTGSTDGNLQLSGSIGFINPGDKYIDLYTNSGASNYTTYIRLLNSTGTSQKNAITATYAGDVTLYYDNSEKLSTLTDGVSITGKVTATSATVGSGVTINSSGINVTGIVTATTFDGSLSGTATSATSSTNANNINISATTSTDTTTSVVLVGSQSTGNQSPFIDSGLTYNANTNTLTATTFSGVLNGNASSSTYSKSVPQNSQTSAYILQDSDSGNHISITVGGVTVPANVFSVGDNITIFNNSNSNQTITQATNVTLRLAGSASTGNRTLGQYGICNVLCVVGGATPTFVISGSGLT
jgi:hypothetical protein